MNYFDIGEQDWQDTKAEMKRILQEVAARRGMIAYSELSNRVLTLRIEPFGSQMSEMLGEIGTEESALKRGILTVIVVHKTGDMEPGTGFYDLAAQLGRDTSDRLKLWVAGSTKYMITGRMLEDFPMPIDAEMPNVMTVAAMQAGDHVEVTTFESLDALMADLNADDENPASGAEAHLLHRLNAEAEASAYLQAKHINNLR